MNAQKPAMFAPALIGGILAGILSGAPFFNCFCCLWIIGGAILAAYFFSKDSPVALGAGDGAILGILTGIIAAVIESIISIPFTAINNAFFRRIMESFSEFAEEMPSGWEAWIEKGTSGFSAPLFMLGLFVSVVVFSFLGSLGGIIGISLFKKKLPSN